MNRPEQNQLRNLHFDPEQLESTEISLTIGKLKVSDRTLGSKNEST